MAIERTHRPLWAHAPDDVPQGEHYAIVVFGSIWIPGDERSRTNPGHGYPEHTEPRVMYIVFKDREEWEREIHRRMVNDKSNDWVPIVARRAKVEARVEVKVVGP